MVVVVSVTYAGEHYFPSAWHTAWSSGY